MKRALLAAGSAAAALVLGEAAVRLFNLGPDVFHVELGMVTLSSDPELRYELVPGFQNPSKDVLVNALGMRDVERTTARAPGALRVACVGDSIAFGMGADNRHTFPVHLERILGGHPSLSGRPVEVLNFGVPGYAIGQVAQTLETKVSGFHPDLVLYLFSLNDAQRYSQELDLLLTRSALTSPDRNYVKALWRQSSRRLGGSRLWLILNHTAAGFFGSRESPPDQNLMPHPRNDMFQLLAGNGIAFYASLYMEPEAWLRVCRGLERIRAWSLERNIPVYVIIMPVFSDADDRTLAALHHRVAEQARSLDLPVMDLLDMFRRRATDLGRRLNSDLLHPNALGYEEAAQAVARRLLSEGVLP
ncbi:MAG: SGNH/GDSL hydrolase family protein [Kiritimatiellae bacterium]|nr:SGNH/GDSL hydrolase family protein [Kiritimatiellia bacterium]